MLVVQTKARRGGAARRAARAAVRAAAEEPAAHDGRGRRGDRPLPRARHRAARRRLPAADDGRVVRVVAADEDLMEVRCADADALARAAYHLGNRHTPVQVGAGWLRFAADDVLAGMLRGLGADGDAGARAVRARGRRVCRRAIMRTPATRSTRASSTISPRAAGDAALIRRDAAGGAAPDGIAPSRRCRSCACCSSRARRCRSARTATRRDSSGWSRPATSAMPRRRRRGSAMSSSCVVAPGEAAVAWRLLVRGAARRLAARSRRGTRGFARRARPPSCAPRREQMGGSLAKLCSDLDLLDAPARDALPALAPVTLPAAYALAARALRGRRRRRADRVRLVLARKPGAGGDQARAARPGRRTAAADVARRADSVRSSRSRSTLADDDLSTFAPGLALASARHETQYTRLFRS